MQAVLDSSGAGCSSLVVDWRQKIPVGCLEQQLMVDLRIFYIALPDTLLQ